MKTNSELSNLSNWFMFMFFGFLSAVCSVIPVILTGILSLLAGLSVERARNLHYAAPRWFCWLGLVTGTLIPLISFLIHAGKIEINLVWIVFATNVITTAIIYPIGVLFSIYQEKRRIKFNEQLQKQALA